ncbi:hypothetical protein OUZ56_002348 [Daphnia magna]|uniref:AB hydrolase-1 domain-containing protein n=1 Tax=Daphnia magna TaxID=35525 RepID=A0ABR0A5V0_9CRUS|nr:hypothetical protein OUZ56_002348 [Daphnia magna]
MPRIHFIHAKPSKELMKNKKVLPLLLLHGWPGSFIEFTKIIPLLTRETEGYDFVFELVVPSLPGYRFSDPPRKPGLGPAEMGLIFDRLMKRLGYDKYYVQGGDWGSLIVISHHNYYAKAAQPIRYGTPSCQMPIH